MPEIAVITELLDIPEVALLAAAPSHTDQSALRAIAEFGYSEAVLPDLYRFGLVIRSENEWRLTASIRDSLTTTLRALRRDVWLQAHEYFFSRTAQLEGGHEDPVYLRTGPGYAYHGSEVDTSGEFHGYLQVAQIESLSVSLSAWRLAREQSVRGVVSADSPDLRFLEAMTLYRSGQVDEAVRILRPISYSGKDSAHAAIAQHLVARWDCRHVELDELSGVLGMFAASLDNGLRRGDVWHCAQVLHSTAVCMLRHNADTAEAISILNESLRLLDRTGDEWGRAMVLHTLGKALGTSFESRDDALSALVESRAIGERRRLNRHVRAVEKTMRLVRSGYLIKRYRDQFKFED